MRTGFKLSAEPMTAMVDEEENLDDSKYLLFRLGDDLYGTPLLGVREIVEPQSFKPVPRSMKYFLGVMNLRGQIVGVIDLRLRLGINAERNSLNALIVFDTEAGPIAALVDRIDAVAAIKDDSIDANPKVSTEVPLDFLLGIARIEGDHLVTLMDLKELLNVQELLAISKKTKGVR